MFLFSVSQSQSNILAANNTLNNIESMSAKNNEKFQRWNSSVSVQLQELRDKIAKAKHAADGVSLTNALPPTFPKLYSFRSQF